VISNEAVKCMICRSGWIVVGHSEIVSARVANEQELRKKSEEHNFERNVLQREVFKNYASPYALMRARRSRINSPWASSILGHHISDWACWAGYSF
jgi:hypothetical protein